MNLNNLAVFSGTSNPELSKSIAVNLGIELGKIYTHTFPSAEKYVQFQENVRGKDIYLVQSLSYPANDNLMELLVMADAARRASANKIIAVCPWLCYSRQERKDKSRVPISAKLVLDMIETSGIDRIISVDLHSPCLQGFINLPFDNLYGMGLLFKALNKTQDVVIIAPDAGAVKRNETLARTFNTGFAFIAKRRLNDSQVESEGFVGDVKGKVAVICDDIMENLSTLIGAAKICREQGAVEVYCLVSHCMITNLGLERLKNDINITKILTTDTILLKEPMDKIQTVSIATLLSEVIKRTQSNESVSELFEVKEF